MRDVDYAALPHPEQAVILVETANDRLDVCIGLFQSRHTGNFLPVRPATLEVAAVVDFAHEAKRDAADFLLVRRQLLAIEGACIQLLRDMLKAVS